MKIKVSADLQIDTAWIITKKRISNVYYERILTGAATKLSGFAKLLRISSPDSVVLLSICSFRFFLGWAFVGFKMIASAGVKSWFSQSTGSWIDERLSNRVKVSSVKSKFSFQRENRFLKTHLPKFIAFRWILSRKFFEPGWEGNPSETEEL